MTRIAVIGGGRIGEALVSGLLAARHPVKDLVVGERAEERARELADRYGVRVTDTVDAVDGAHVIVVAVKPADVEATVAQISQADLDGSTEQLLVSLAAGIPTSFYEKRLPAGFPVVRVMPNTPMLVGEGMSVLAPGRHVQSGQLDLIEGILSSVGRVATVPESQIDAVTAVSGSGPAYVFLVAEAMIDAAVALGLGRPVARELVVQTLCGSAAMLGEGDSATELRAAVTSPGGTTAAALRELEAGGLRTAFYDAVDAAARRSAELGGKAE
ncbi:pyrroline-5-carboxylate reductase [Rhodococcus rhodnii]|uniref:Pyrroline-5-carboxylate reductase n=1 Tax=Rhodococcus rhodnii TaxID=38312 RepID=A0A6P2CLE4_9NOCA|nr:pyrroline-5-carboxylate reductase [Rhodococcus rhodnii]TXG91976.1 pyrroline-5-carboxylate reductase [Rhodococcus rhodnii]